MPKKLLPKPEKGLAEGYHVRDSEIKRHRALNAAIRKHGATKILRHINLIKVMNKAKPDIVRSMQADLEFIRAHK